MRLSALMLLTFLLAGCSGRWPSNDPLEQNLPPEPCFVVTQAIENGDEDTLSRFEIPVFIDADTLDGVATRRLCTSSTGPNSAPAFLLTIERDSGQVVIVRNDRTIRMVDAPLVVDAAIDSIRDQVGMFVVTDHDAVRPRPAADNDESTPIRSILE